jgi:hypothetical protein
MIAMDEDRYNHFVERCIARMKKIRMDLRDGGTYSRMTLGLLRDTVVRRLAPQRTASRANGGGIQRWVHCLPSSIQEQFPSYGPEIMEEFWTVVLNKQEARWLQKALVTIHPQWKMALSLHLTKGPLSPASCASLAERIHGTAWINQIRNVCIAYTLLVFKKRVRIPTIGLYARLLNVDVQLAAEKWRTLDDNSKGVLYTQIVVDRVSWERLVQRFVKNGV